MRGALKPPRSHVRTGCANQHSETHLFKFRLVMGCRDGVAVCACTRWAAHHHEGAAMRSAIILFLAGLFIPSMLLAEPVNSINFPNGQVLDIQGSVGSGPNSAFLAIDFSNNAPPGPAYAWQYNWTGTSTELGMLNAIGAADSALTVVPDPTYGYDFIDNFNYGTNIGSAQPFPASGSYSFWASYIGQYDSGTQSVNWVFAPSGADLLNLGDLYDASGDLLASGQEGLLYGWTINGEFQTTNLTPNLPTTVPEPATFGLLLLTGLGFLGTRQGFSFGRIH
jgi:hypothetical protein